MTLLYIQNMLQMYIVDKYVIYWYSKIQDLVWYTFTNIKKNSIIYYNDDKTGKSRPRDKLSTKGSRRKIGCGQPKKSIYKYNRQYCVLKGMSPFTPCYPTNIWPAKFSAPMQIHCVGHLNMEMEKYLWICISTHASMVFFGGGRIWTK